MSNPTNPKILLVGWNAAGWDVVTPLLDQGELPHLAGLVQRGVMGGMTSIRPLMEPMVYTSLATGKFPGKHGIFGTHEVYDHGRLARPISSRSRRAKAFWEILSQEDVRSNVVHFPTPQPAEQLNGAFVSRGFFGPPRTSSWSPVHVPEDSVCPADLGVTLQEFIVALEDLDPPTIGLFVPRMSDLPSRDQRLAQIAMGLAHTLSVHAVATWVMENTEWHLMSVNYPIIELFSLSFLRYQPPRLDWVEEEEFNLFSQVVNGSVRLCDLLLGRLVDLAGEGATTIVYSPRAYLAPQQLPRGAAPVGPRTEAEQHRPQGIFVLRADAARQDELIHSVREVDVCPTVLSLCGVAVPGDMDGRVLADAFAQPVPEAKTIETWETRPPTRPELPPDMPPTPWTELMSFTSGYAPRTALWVQMQNDWNQAEANLQASRPDLAVPLLTRLYYTTPFWTNMAPLVAEALQANGLVDEALIVMRNYVAIHGETPTGQFLAGLMAQHEGRDSEARERFEEAAKAAPPIPQLYFHLGEAHRRAHALDRALECYHRAVEIDASYIPGHLGVILVHRRSKDYEAATDEALKVLAIDFAYAPAHYLLGTCLEGLGEPERAKEAYANALRFNSSLEPAKTRLAALESGDEPKPIDEDEAAPVESPRRDVDQLRQGVHRARQEVAAWANHYIRSFQQADQRLDAYLAENARQLPRQDGETPHPAPSTLRIPTLEEKGVIVRPVMPADLAQLGPLVTPVLAEHHRHDVFVLHQTGEDRLFGAVCLRLGEDAGQHVTLLVHPASVAAATDAGLEEEALWWLLLRAGVARAAAAGVSEVSYNLSPEGREHLAEYLMRLGFRVKKRETVLRMDMAVTRDRCLRVVERYKQRQAIPDDVRVASLQDVPMYKVDRFFRRFFDDGIGPRRLDLDKRLSLLVLRGSEIIAAYAGYIQDEMWVSPRLAVLAEYQSGWATPMLIGEGSKAGYESGLRSIGIYADESVFPEMIRIGRRTGAEEITRTWTMGLDLVAPWSDSGA